MQEIKDTETGRTYRDTELLAVLGLVDTTARNISSQDTVEVFCSNHRQTTSMVLFKNLIKGYRNSGRGWHCFECKNQTISLKMKAKTGKMNGFYGKTHSESTNKQRAEKNKEWFKTPDGQDFLKNLAETKRAEKLEKNPMSDPAVKEKHRVIVKRKKANC
jgi:hypothetical protein